MNNLYRKYKIAVAIVLVIFFAFFMGMEFYISYSEYKSAVDEYDSSKNKISASIDNITKEFNSINENTSHQDLNNAIDNISQECFNMSLSLPDQAYQYDNIVLPSYATDLLRDCSLLVQNLADVQYEIFAFKDVNPKITKDNLSIPTDTFRSLKRDFSYFQNRNITFVLSIQPTTFLILIFDMILLFLYIQKLIFDNKKEEMKSK